MLEIYEQTDRQTDTQTDRQTETDRHAHHNTSYPYKCKVKKKLQNGIQST